MTYEYYEAPMSYDEIVATQGEILKDWTLGSYQGDYVYLLKNDDRYAFTVIGYGSCSGCDALEGCESDEEFNQLKESITSGIVWGIKQEVYDYVFNQEANRWYFHEEDWLGIRKEIMEILA
jgi:hypothetical protein